MKTAEERASAKVLAQQKMLDFYNMVPDAPIYKKEMCWFVLERWTREGYLKPIEQVADYDAYLNDVFDYDEPAYYSICDLGWMEPAFSPQFEVKVLEDRGAHEVVQDSAGRSVLYFKGRRQGFMPTYLEHPVIDMKTWEENVKWRLDPKEPIRLKHIQETNRAIQWRQEQGDFIVQRVIGGFMYLRALMGPEGILYALYDDPQLVHSCMQAWLALSDAVIAEHQKAAPLDEVFLAEDICYKGGSLISPAMMKEFLFPYYQQLFANIRQRNRGHKLHIQIDTDGMLNNVIDLYRELGMDYMSPFEVAAGCSVTETAKKYPDLLISGGIDKRMIALGGDAIKRHLESIMPFMRKRGGYIPTCDHGVPEEVTFENYMLYRRLIKEYCD